MYVVVKYGQDVMFKTQVVKKSLNPDWHKNVTLSSPPPDKIIIVVSAPVNWSYVGSQLYCFNSCLQERWDKDHFSDNFIGSIQLSEDSLTQFQVCICSYECISTLRKT